MYTVFIYEISETGLAVVENLDYTNVSSREACAINLNLKMLFAARSWQLFTKVKKEQLRQLQPAPSGTSICCSLSRSSKNQVPSRYGSG